MRIAMRHLNRRGVGQIVDPILDPICFGTGTYVGQDGNVCCGIDAEFGLCTPVLPTSTGAPVANLQPPAPVDSGVNYSPATNLGQQQGAAAQQLIQTQASAATATGTAPPANVAAAPGNEPLISTTTWVLIGIAAVLGVILTVKS